MTDAEIRAAAARFATKGTYTGFEQNTKGHINKTFVLRYDDGGRQRRYVMQIINTAIFKQPLELIENIAGVTDFLRAKIAAAGGDPARETLRLIPTVDGALCCAGKDGAYYRMYDYIEGAISHEQVESPQMFRSTGEAFGRFQRLLADYPAETLHETIPKFHDTVSRLADFRASVAQDRAGRAAEVQDEITRYLSHASLCSCVTDRIADGTVPLRVTHNDTKLNNIMLDTVTGEGVCVIDLDTVMPGSALYDFGDAIRFGASSAAEDEKDLSRVEMRLDLFDAFVDGFLASCRDTLTETEIRLLPESAMLMTLECGMRFLGDYLNGDIYFGIHYPTQNLDRARTQLKLVEDMETKLNAMREIVKKHEN